MSVNYSQSQLCAKKRKTKEEVVNISIVEEYKNRAFLKFRNEIGINDLRYEDLSSLNIADELGIYLIIIQCLVHITTFLVYFLTSKIKLIKSLYTRTHLKLKFC